VRGKAVGWCGAVVCAAGTCSDAVWSRIGRSGVLGGAVPRGIWHSGQCCVSAHVRVCTGSLLGECTCHALAHCSAIVQSASVELMSASTCFIGVAKLAH